MANESNKQNDVIGVEIIVLFSNYLNNADHDDPDDLLKVIGGTESLSNAGMIKVLNSAGKYIIAIPVTECMIVDSNILLHSILSILDKNIASSVVNIKLVAKMHGKNIQNSILTEEFLREASTFISLHNTITSELRKSQKFDYIISESVTVVAQSLQILRNAMMNESAEINESDTRYPFLSADFDEVDIGDGDYMSQFVEYKEGKSKKKKKKKSPKYSTSKVLRCAKSPKRAYKRHGVIVCKDKDAIRRDRRIIKDFLEDFIPGNAGWKKDLRKDLLDRWVHVYVITKKRLRKLEDQQRKNAVRNKTGADIIKTIDLTRKMFSVPVDKWNDPTR